MLTILIRAIILYLTMIIAMRVMGKGQLGQFQPFELAMTLMIADILATPMADVSTPLLHGILPVAAMIFTHSAFAIVCVKSNAARGFLSGRPSVLVSGGIINQKEMKRLCISVSDLLEGVRECGMQDINDVDCAIMEADGGISAFPKACKRPVCVEDLSLSVPQEGAVHALIMDGEIQSQNLLRANVNRQALLNALAGKKLRQRDVYLASIDAQGLLTIQTNGTVIQTNIANAREGENA